MRCSLFIQWDSISATNNNYTQPHKWILQIDCWMGEARHKSVHSAWSNVWIYIIKNHGTNSGEIFIESNKRKIFYFFPFAKGEMIQRLLGDNVLYLCLRICSVCKDLSTCTLMTWCACLYICILSFQSLCGEGKELKTTYFNFVLILLS